MLPCKKTLLHSSMLARCMMQGRFVAMHLLWHQLRFTQCNAAVVQCV
jgi:hypothetical protein